MIHLKDDNGNVLSTGIKSLSPVYYDVISIENKLLDGTLHVQTIGDPHPYKIFQILSDNIQVNQINQVQAIGGVFTLIEDGEYFKGLISLPKWTRISHRHPDPYYRFYTSEIRLDITEEGLI